MPLTQINLTGSPNKIPQHFVDYLEKNWPLLAATAYRGYQQKGRGLLWVDWLNQLPIQSCISEVAVLYLAPHSAIARSIFPGGMSAEMRRMLKRYDPELNLIVCWSDGDAVRARTVSIAGAESPLEAYKSLSERISEFDLFFEVKNA